MKKYKLAILRYSPITIPLKALSDSIHLIYYTLRDSYYDWCASVLSGETEEIPADMSPREFANGDKMCALRKYLAYAITRRNTILDNYILCFLPSLSQEQKSNIIGIALKHALLVGNIISYRYWAGLVPSYIKRCGGWRKSSFLEIENCSDGRILCTFNSYEIKNIFLHGHLNSINYLIEKLDETFVDRVSINLLGKRKRHKIIKRLFALEKRLIVLSEEEATERNFQTLEKIIKRYKKEFDQGAFYWEKRPKDADTPFRRIITKVSIDRLLKNETIKAKHGTGLLIWYPPFKKFDINEFRVSE